MQKRKRIEEHPPFVWFECDVLEDMLEGDIEDVISYLKQYPKEYKRKLEEYYKNTPNAIKNPNWDDVKYFELYKDYDDDDGYRIHMRYKRDETINELKARIIEEEKQRKQAEKNEKARALKAKRGEMALYKKLKLKYEKQN